MNKLALLLIFFIVTLLSIITSSFLVHAAIAVSPNCYDAGPNASCTYRITYEDREDFKFKVYNKGDRELTYRVSVPGYNESITKINPKEFTLVPGDGRACDGKSCQEVIITINTASFLGKKDFTVLAETVLGGGALPLILQTQSKILIDKRNRISSLLIVSFVITLALIIFVILKYTNILKRKKRR